MPCRSIEEGAFPLQLDPIRQAGKSGLAASTANNNMENLEIGFSARPSHIACRDADARGPAIRRRRLDR
jgi:hypothetical protein